MSDLLALTLYPEWAYAIAHLGKRVENRTWKRDSMVGQMLAIHGGKNIGGAPKQDWAYHATGMIGVAKAAGAPMPDPITLRSLLEQGQGIVAVARVVRFVRQLRLDDPAAPWFFGPWGWMLDQVRVLPRPVPCRGSQGLWPVPDDALLRVHELLTEARCVPAPGGPI